MPLQVRGGSVDGWDRFDPYHIFGVKPGSAAPAAPLEGGPALAGSAGPGLLEAGMDRPWHPDSPLFWFGALLAVTVGLIGASTSVRLGPFRASVKAGDT